MRRGIYLGSFRVSYPFFLFYFSFAACAAPGRLRIIALKHLPATETRHKELHLRHVNGPQEEDTLADGAFVPSMSVTL